MADGAVATLNRKGSRHNFRAPVDRKSFLQTQKRPVTVISESNDGAVSDRIQRLKDARQKYGRQSIGKKPAKKKAHLKSQNTLFEEAALTQIVAKAWTDVEKTNPTLAKKID